MRTCLHVPGRGVLIVSTLCVKYAVITYCSHLPGLDEAWVKEVSWRALYAYSNGWRSVGHNSFKNCYRAPYFQTPKTRGEKRAYCCVDAQRLGWTSARGASKWLLELQECALTVRAALQCLGGSRLAARGSAPP